MVKNEIKVYARVKPTKGKKEHKECEIREGTDDQALIITVKHLESAVNNKPEVYKFRFHRIFDGNTRQPEVFDVVARPVIDSALHGYNGTIFAYGQTGSGKTFTITGGSSRYEDRGIIPRTMQYIFQETHKSTATIYSTYISYLEIYNENGYDLLNPNHNVTKLDDLPRVSFLEDSKGNLHIRNLSVHPVATEEETLNLLFMGDTNRAIAETPMNPFSSRSHCVFTVHLSMRGSESSTMLRSKLHLVDLAGSERIHKCKAALADRTILEARHINLSLHYLEQVIIALGEAKRTHIPYRNSMMTSILRDSLGGNCHTTMVATLSLEITNIQETISTCRFAQRVALISNDAILNEEMDPQQEIAHLRCKLKQLKDQIAVLTGKEYADELTEEECQECQEIVNKMMVEPGVLQLPSDLRKIKFCCRLLKEAAESASKLSLSKNHNCNVEDKRMKDLEQIVQQRDNEIGILIHLLRKERQKRLEHANGSSNQAHNSRERLAMKDHLPEELYDIITKSGHTSSMAEHEAFLIYMSDKRNRTTIEFLQGQLKMKYAEAKNIGCEIEESQRMIVDLRTKVDQLQEEMVCDSDTSEKHQQEQITHAQRKVEVEQTRYRENLAILRNLKSETDHLKHGIRQESLKLMHGFQSWWMHQQSKSQKMQSIGDNRSKSQNGSNISTEKQASMYSTNNSSSKNITKDKQVHFTQTNSHLISKEDNTSDLSQTSIEVNKMMEHDQAIGTLVNSAKCNYVLLENDQECNFSRYPASTFPFEGSVKEDSEDSIQGIPERYDTEYTPKNRRQSPGILQKEVECYPSHTKHHSNLQVQEQYQLKGIPKDYYSEMKLHHFPDTYHNRQVKKGNYQFCHTSQYARESCFDNLLCSRNTASQRRTPECGSHRMRQAFQAETEYGSPQSESDYCRSKSEADNEHGKSKPRASRIQAPEEEIEYNTPQSGSDGERSKSMSGGSSYTLQGQEAEMEYGSPQSGSEEAEIEDSSPQSGSEREHSKLTSRTSSYTLQRAEAEYSSLQSEADSDCSKSVPESRTTVFTIRQRKKIPTPDIEIVDGQPSSKCVLAELQPAKGQGSEKLMYESLHTTVHKNVFATSSSDIDLETIPLTGDKEVDEEIIAFYRMKQKAMLRRQKNKK